MGRSKEGWYERKEIQKVTLDWVRDNCRLTNRERELLQLVHYRKLVRRDHLEIISPSYREAGENRTILLNRAIKKMFHQMLLDKVHEVKEIGKGNTPSIVAIDKGGSIILGVPHKKRITHRTSIVKGIHYITRILPINYRHINGVNQTEVDTILLCEETNNDILRWELEVATNFKHSGEDILFIPDIFMEIRLKDDRRLLAFIEYDTGSENHRNKTDFPVIHDKLINYSKYKMSGLWEEHYKYFPMVLLVTEDDKRIPYFNSKCQELELQGMGIYYENYTKVLRRLIDR